MAEPLPVGVQGYAIYGRNRRPEIVAAGWLTFPTGELSSAAQVLLVRRGRDGCAQAYLSSIDHSGPYLLEYQATPTSDRERFCLDCAADARDNGEFLTLEWTHTTRWFTIPDNWLI